MKYVYDAEYNGKDNFCNRDTPDEVKKHLDEQFAEDCEFDGIEHMEVRTDEAYILKIDENGDIVERTPYELLYEGYHGDLKEHGTW